MTISVRQLASLPEDASGNPVEFFNVDKWHPQRVAVLEASWTAIPATPMAGRTSLLIQAHPSNTSTIILAPDATNYSNSLSDANCGIILPVSGSIEPHFGANLLVYARVVAGGNDGAVIVSEAR